MIQEQTPQEFTDISGILYRDIQIEFSACELLDNDDYLMLTPLRQQKLLKSKQKNKGYKSNQRKGQKQQHILPKNINEEPLKSRKDTQGCKGEAYQKQTQDSCQTAAKSLSIQSPKAEVLKRQKINENKMCLQSPKIVSNKNQLLQKNRSRSKSSTSLQSFRKKSAIQMGDFSRKSICSSISTAKNPGGQKMGKVRSQTIRQDFQQIKLKNQNIIRNDYFQEVLPQSPHKQKQGKGNLLKGSRSVSQTKKIEMVAKKAKRKDVLVEKNSAKVQKARRK